MSLQISRARRLAAATTFATSLIATAAIAAGSTPTHASVGAVAPAPTGVTGVAGVDSAAISFTAPPSSTPAVTSYTVTAYPGAEQGFGATSPVSVTGLQPNVAYTFQVAAASAAGRGPGSAPSAALTALAPATGVSPPALSGLRVSLASFFVSGAGSSGTTFSYSDTEAAATTLTVLRVRQGTKHAGTCLVNPGASGRPCKSLSLVGRLSVTDVAGLNKVHFSGRIAGHRLVGGLYQVRFTPTLGGVPGNTLQSNIDVF
jgi:hypothetical protein